MQVWSKTELTRERQVAGSRYEKGMAHNMQMRDIWGHVLSGTVRIRDQGRTENMCPQPHPNCIQTTASKWPHQSSLHTGMHTHTHTHTQTLRK